MGAMEHQFGKRIAEFMSTKELQHSSTQIERNHEDSETNPKNLQSQRQNFRGNSNSQTSQDRDGADIHTSGVMAHVGTSSGRHHIKEQECLKLRETAGSASEHSSGLVVASADEKALLDLQVAELQKHKKELEYMNAAMEERMAELQMSRARCMGLLMRERTQQSSQSE